MSTTRRQIVVSWLSFSLFCLLLVFWWRYRLLWLGLFLPAWIILSLFKPRIPQPPRLTLLFGLAFLVFLFAFVVHGFLFPKSEALSSVMKILCPLSLAPALCYKAYTDYVAFRSSNSQSGQPGGAANPAGASRLQSVRPVRRVAELGSLGVNSATSMRTFSIALLSGLAALNCLLGYLTHQLAGPMYRAFMQHGTDLPLLTAIAVHLPPWFYVLAVAALLVICFGFWRRPADYKLVYAAVALLIVDVAGLLASFWGYCGSYMEMTK